MRPRPCGARIREILADGEWHTIDELIRDAGRLIPPSYAIRRAERARLSQLKQDGRGPQPRVFGDTTTALASGKRTVVREAIRAGRVGGVFEVDTRDGVQIVRALTT